MKNVLLTGASGFIGRHAIEPLLARGYEVHAVTHTRNPSGLAGAQWHKASLLSLDEIRFLVAEVQPTHLLHLAWNAAPGEYKTSPDNLRWVQASLELYMSFVANGGRRAVGAGTCIEYELTDERCSEKTSALIPTTLYGACKHALHLTTAAFGREVGLSTAWGRVFFLYGPHEHPTRLVASVVQSLLAGESVKTTHGKQVRDFLYVADVASALVALLDSDVEGAVNIASGEPIELATLLHEIGETTGRPELIEIGALDAPYDEPPTIYGDAGRLRNEVGWAPGYDLSAGVEETTRWWRSQMMAEAAPTA